MSLVAYPLPVPSPVVSADWVHNHSAHTHLKLFDASWSLPDTKRDEWQDYQQQRIPNARFFDIDLIADRRSDLPHMAPPISDFAQAMAYFDIVPQDCIVVYDSTGLFSAPRVWWLCRLMGYRNVAVLNGGFPAWQKAAYPVETTPPRFGRDPLALSSRTDTTEQNKAVYDAALVCSKADVKAYSSQNGQIVDARSRMRFLGRAPEPRPNTRSGHIAGSHNLHYENVLSKDGFMQSVDHIRACFESINVDVEKPIITMCGSGVTAAILDLALVYAGHAPSALYDGSWSEWGHKP